MFTTQYRSYYIALILLVFTLVLSQIVIQYSILTNDDYGRTVNIAGRQRMLSQRINKAAFGIYIHTDQESTSRYLSELTSSLDLWQESHDGLINQNEELGLTVANSKTVDQLFKDIETPYKNIVEAASQIKKIASHPEYAPESIQQYVQVISENENDYLTIMDTIVFQYDVESKQKMLQISRIEIVIFTASLLVLVVEILFIFRPGLRFVKLSIDEVETGKELVIRERELFETTIDAVSEGVIVTDGYGKIQLMNPRAAQFTEWPIDATTGVEFKNVFNFFNIATKKRISSPTKIISESEALIDSPHNIGIISNDGSERLISANVASIYSEENILSKSVISFRDITKEYSLENEIEGFLNVNLDMLCVHDQSGNFIKINRKFEEILGYQSKDIQGKNFIDFVHEDDIQATGKFISLHRKKMQMTGFVNRYRCKNGSYKYIEWNSLPGVAEYIYISARDITEQHLDKEQLKQMAIRDGLTGLYNRYFLAITIEQEMKHADRYNHPISLMIIDLDHFKQVNDRWGHPVGDDLLKSMAQIIHSSIRDSDILVRFGGEEFIVVMPQTSIGGATIAAEKVRTAIEDNPHPVTGRQTASVGVAERMKAESYRHWYSRVDEALYSAKQAGRNCVIASDEEKLLSVDTARLFWNQQWNSGNRELDQQHQELVEIANHLIVVFTDGVEDNILSYQLDLLINHITNHFTYEEKLLNIVGYPEYRLHLEIHKNLLVKAKKLKKAYERGEVRAPAFFSFLADDLVYGHLVEEDIKFFPYLAGHDDGLKEN